MSELIEINKLINSPPYSLQLICSPGFYISLFAPMIENDNAILNQISSSIETWQLSSEQNSYILIDGNRVGLDYSNMAADDITFNVDGSILQKVLRDDDKYFSIVSEVDSNGIQKVRVSLTDLVLSNTTKLAPAFGVYSDKAGYMFDKFIESTYKYTVTQYDENGWGIEKNENSPLLPVIPTQISGSDGTKIAFTVDPTSWKFHLTGGLLEKNRNNISGVPSNEYQALYSFFWGGPNSFPSNPIWLQFYEDHNSSKHSLLAQFDNSVMNKITSSMILYPGDISYEHYIDKVGMLSKIEYGRIPILTEQEGSFYRLSSSDYVEATTEFSIQSILSADDSASGVMFSADNGTLKFDNEYNVISSETLRRTKGDWIVDGVSNGNSIVNGKIFSKGETFELSKIVGFSLENWMRPLTSLVVSKDGFKKSLSGSEIDRFFLEEGIWEFALEMDDE